MARIAIDPARRFARPRRLNAGERTLQARGAGLELVLPAHSALVLRFDARRS
jgi:hypothetical protein